MNILKSAQFFIDNPHLSPDMLPKETRQPYYEMLNCHVEPEDGEDFADCKNLQCTTAELDEELLEEIEDFFAKKIDVNEDILEKIYNKNIREVNVDILKRYNFRGELGLKKGKKTVFGEYALTYTPTLTKKIWKLSKTE